MSLSRGDDPFFVSRHDQIVALAASHRIPAMYFSREFTEAGGLLSYGASLIDSARQGGVYAGKILHFSENRKGVSGVPAIAEEHQTHGRERPCTERREKPADLPVMQSINSNLSVPQSASVVQTDFGRRAERSPFGVITGH
jgi:hypothetical protein